MTAGASAKKGRSVGGDGRLQGLQEGGQGILGLGNSVTHSRGIRKL